MINTHTRLDRTAFSASAVSSICHAALIVWLLWSVGVINDTNSDENPVHPAPTHDDHSEALNSTPAPLPVPEFFVMMPDSHTDNLGQMELPPLPELAQRTASEQFITPQLFQSPDQLTERNPETESDGDDTPQIQLPSSRYQVGEAALGAAAQGDVSATHTSDIIKNMSSYWYTINAIILSNQYNRVWRKRFHEHLPRHALLLSIHVKNSALVAVTLKRGTGNHDFDTIFMVWLQGCIERHELHGPPVNDGTFPVEFLIR